VENVSNKYQGQVNYKIYYAGKDFDYIKKYGMMMRGTLIINEEKRIDMLSKKVIEDAIRNAVEEQN